MKPASATILKVKVSGGICLDHLPEITVLNREIERFKKLMLKNPSLEEENGYRIIAERHYLNGLIRAKELLLLDHHQIPQ